LIANKPIKQAFKKTYVSWKIRNNPGPSGKYRVEQRDIDSMEEVFQKLTPNSQTAKVFSMYGQDVVVTMRKSYWNIWQSMKKWFVSITSQ
jgi:hypothetical protein